jgi:hypothetical protein
MEITINFASESYDKVQRVIWRWRWITCGVVLLTTALLYASIWSYYSTQVNRKRISELEDRISQEDRLQADAKAFLNRGDIGELRLRAELLNLAIARKAFSWTEVFADLERVMPPHLHVTSIHPRIDDDNELELQLVVSGPTREGRIELVRRLEQSAHFARARITGENAQSAPSSFQCSITAIYIPRFARQGVPLEKKNSGEMASKFAKAEQYSSAQGGKR